LNRAAPGFAEAVFATTRRVFVGANQLKPFKTHDLLIKFERFPPTCILIAVSKLTKVAAMLALVLYGLASMHCALEGVPGLDFLETCCSEDSAPAAPQGCESDGCGPVEGGKYRPEDQTVTAPQPLLVCALFSLVVEALPPEPQAPSLVASESPPELPKVWQFSHRTALPPRAPSLAS
jgi:hypothetical protein